MQTDLIYPRRMLHRRSVTELMETPHHLSGSDSASLSTYSHSTGTLGGKAMSHTQFPPLHLLSNTPEAQLCRQPRNTCRRSQILVLTPQPKGIQLQPTESPWVGVHEPLKVAHLKQALKPSGLVRKTTALAGKLALSPLPSRQLQGKNHSQCTHKMHQQFLVSRASLKIPEEAANIRLKPNPSVQTKYFPHLGDVLSFK